jgi:U3 small nucleolar RNA-associated protein 6
MDAARGYFMRGCRFCNRGWEVWVEYARCEMEWLAKMQKKRRGGEGEKGGPAPVKISEAVDEDGNMQFDDDDSDEEHEDGELMLPDPDAEFGGEKPKREVFGEEAVKRLEDSPALDGAIPMAVFDVARKQTFFGPPAAEAFFDVFAGFTDVSCSSKLVQHVLDCMMAAFPTHPATGSCYVRQPLIGVDYRTAGFPRALREALARLKSMLESTRDKAALAAKTLVWIETLLGFEDLDAGIRLVLEHTKGRLEEA